MPVLTGIDVQGVQRYVFASNRLRDAVAASWLVDWVTTRLDARLDGRGQVLVAGGGNATLRFADHQSACAFVTKLTWDLHEKAPGLELAVAHHEYAEGGLAAALVALQTALAAKKLARRPSVPQLGLSVTTRCRISGQPAIGFDPVDTATPLSAMVLRWRDPHIRAEANQRWDAFLDPERFAFPPELDDMGRTRGDTSLVGVVHLDGNGIGERIGAWLEACVAEGRSDATVLEEMRSWSQAVDDLGRRALTAVAERVMLAVEEEEPGRPLIRGTHPDLGFELSTKEERTQLPLRPVLLGGDDLTFLCDGRLALDLAQTALGVFGGEMPCLGSVSACAGVAIVAAHSPFDRAYDLAEALCGSAKAKRREEGDQGNWLDWHVGDVRPGEGVHALRQRAYSQGGRHLTCRPYPLGGGEGAPGSWRWLAGTVLGSGAPKGGGLRGGGWAKSRNKVKELLALVRGGPEVIGWARARWTIAGELPLPGGLDGTNGFIGTRTPLLDALELMDIHLPLDRGTER